MMLWVLPLTLGARTVVRSGGTVLVDEAALNGTRQQVARCCCSDQEPEPKYLCADLRTKRLYLPALPAKPQGATHHFPVSFTSRVFETSHCEGGKSVAHPIEQDQIATGAVERFQQRLTDGPVHTVFRAELANQAHSLYQFGDDDRYKKYSSYKKYSKNFKSEVLKAKHVEYNGVIYGPTDEHKESKSVHGTPYCSMWEKVSDVSVKKKKPTFDAEANTWTFETTCKEHLLCRDFTIGHACGFDPEHTVLLKRAGRRGECTAVESTLFGGTHCPSGQFHNSVTTKGGLGGMTWKFCDCRSEALPSGECTMDSVTAPEVLQRRSDDNA